MRFVLTCLCLAVLQLQLQLLSLAATEAFLPVRTPQHQSRQRQGLRLRLRLQLFSTTQKNGSVSSKKKRRRKPAFPSGSYSLAKDEAELKHHFISFIDQSLMSTYSQKVQLVEPRLYARPDQFLKENASERPTIEDVAEPTSFYGEIATFFSWNGLPARAIVGGMSYLAFPYIVSFLETATQDIDNHDLTTLTDTFIPGISIVLGTYFSLTLSILYDRFTNMQEAVSSEAAFLALTCNNLLHLFQNDQDAAVEGAQCIADQVRTMVFDSRGKETMGIVYSDPYTRILNLLKDHHQDNGLDTMLLGDIRNSLKELFMLRSKRMNYEALALAPTHFDVMTFLTAMLMIGFALGTVATAQTDGIPVELSRILFASLMVVFTVSYEMAWDLNRPFDGVYQLKRSGAAMHFLHIKNIVVSHPLVAGLVDFEEIVDDEAEIPEFDGNSEVRKDEIWFN